MTKKIKVTSMPEVHIDIDELHNFQGELKVMDDKSRYKLRRSIIEEGFAMPVAFFENAGVKYILDGHQRLDVMQSLKAEGYEIPAIPAHEIKAKDYNHAKKILASFISQYGKITKKGFADFFDGVDFDVVNDFEFPDISSDFFDDMDISFDKDFSGVIDEESQDDIDGEISPFTEEDKNEYSKKVERPIYEAKGEKPVITEICNVEKYKKLIAKIEQSHIPAEEKLFLKLAAGRHIVFRYDKIAEYYCHSESETQELFEDSALVIIDFDKAIEEGYVHMVDAIQDQYKIDKGIVDEK